MDEKTRNALARIAAEWHKSTSSRVGHSGDGGARRVGTHADNGAMSPIALRHRRYQQLIRLRKAG